MDKTVERKVLHAIKGVLRFYEYESDEITNIDTGLALIFLKGKLVLLAATFAYKNFQQMICITFVQSFLWCRH